MRKAVSLLFAATLAAISISFLGCQTRATQEGQKLALQGETTFEISLPPGLESESVNRAVSAALINRGWTIVQRADRMIVAELIHRDTNAHVTITWNDQYVTIEDSSTDKHGQPFVPVRWIEYLKKDIGKFLNTAAI